MRRYWKFLIRHVEKWVDKPARWTSPAKARPLAIKALRDAEERRREERKRESDFWAAQENAMKD